MNLAQVSNIDIGLRGDDTVNAWTFCMYIRKSQYMLTLQMKLRTSIQINARLELYIHMHMQLT